ncbi:hypothetical protein GSU75_05443 [Pseudomonas savastanoi pv. phaseolicola]|nr:hypothetical protein [Pseudomonas savastanoi pv. phaseolicola]MBN4179293.1 hypothetical protein [Pseudomonas savastanoi pv. phaseolicola]
MKTNKTLLASLAFATLCTSVTAQAGPAVTVTFKNLGSEVAEYKPVTRNEISARLNAKSPINSAVPPGRFRYLLDAKHSLAGYQLRQCSLRHGVQGLRILDHLYKASRCRRGQGAEMEPDCKF